MSGLNLESTHAAGDDTAIDLEVTSKEGNCREHIDLNYMITDQGWRLTHAREEGGMVITASKEGRKKKWPVEAIQGAVFDRLVAAIDSNGPLPRDIIDIRMAAEDIKILRDAMGAPGQTIPVNLNLD